MSMVSQPLTNGINFSKDFAYRISLSGSEFDRCEDVVQEYFVEDKNKDSRPKVLYVEDEEIARKAGLYFLQKMDCRIDVAVNGKEVLDLYFANQYDLILLDGGLPDISGFEVGKIIRTHELTQQRTPLILLSAYPYDLVKAECTAADIDDFAIKPVKFFDLQEMLASWFAQAGKTFNKPFIKR